VLSDLQAGDEGTGTRPDYLVNLVPKKLRGRPGKKLLRNRERVVR